MTTTVTLIEGTFGGAWAEDGSPFRTMLEREGFRVVRFQGWTLNVGGVPNLLSRGKHRDWCAGGWSLGYLLRGMALEDRNVICHSHGIGPTLYEPASCGQIPINRVISVCSPVRADLQELATEAVKRIGRWRHIAATDGDPWQRLGEIFDGKIGWNERKWKQAHENLAIPGIGHSQLLNDPDYFSLWKDDGMLEFLRGRADQVAPAFDAGAAA